MALSACAPEVPDSAAGVGFGDYESYQSQREAQLSGAETLPGAHTVTQIPLDGTEAQAAADARALNSGEAPVEASPNNPAPTVVASSNGISRENDFDAVSGERSIQDDANLIAQNRSQYQVIQPTDLPARSGNQGPNVVDYALKTNHPVGTQLYKRSSFNAQNKYTRNCAKYLTGDQAQMAFLQSGGPERDRYGLDPDGDGYACEWNPAPFRLARTQDN